MATFKFKGAEYDMVSRDDLTIGELDDMERYTATNAIEGKIAIGGLIWISVRRKVPKTTFADIASEKFIEVELDDEEAPESLPPTSNGAAGSSMVDAPTELPDPINTGSPG